MPSLGLNSLTTKEKLEIIAWKSLNASISSYKNKSVVRSMFEKNEKKRSSRNKICNVRKLFCATIC